MTCDRFGAFDGRFLGITIELSGAGRRSRLPWLSPTCLDRAAAAPILSCVDADAPLTGLLEATCVTHELRHFHDFALSPIGASALRARYLATINTMPLLPWFACQPGVLPVPLSAWIKLPESHREAYWSRASRLFAADEQPFLRPLAVPYASVVGLGPGPPGEGEAKVTKRRFGDGEIGDVLHLIAGQFERAEYMLGGVAVRHDRWNPAQLFEANALVTQMQHLRLATSATIANGVLTELHFANGDYAKVLKRVGALLGAPAPGGAVRVALPDIAALCTYALAGPCEPKYSYGQAIVRFCAIAKHVAGGTMPVAEMAIRELYEHWDRVLEADGLLTAPTFEGIEASLAIDAELARDLDEELAVKPTRYDLTLPIKLCFREFLAARRVLCEHFLDDPDAYVRPKAYLQQLPRLPRPAVRIASPPEENDAAMNLLQAEGWTSCLRANEAEILVNPPGGFLPGGESFRLETLDLATDAMMGSEMIFADNPAVAEAGRRFLSSVLGDRVTLMHVSLPRDRQPASLREGAARFFV
jgi:hypothetical protein